MLVFAEGCYRLRNKSLRWGFDWCDWPRDRKPTIDRDIVAKLRSRSWISTDSPYHSCMSDWKVWLPVAVICAMLPLSPIPRFKA